MTEKCWPHSSGHHKLAGLYNLKKTLGRGHFAVVRLAQHVFTGENVAIKVIDKTKLDHASMDHLYHEVTCMKLVQHPNVVRLYEVIETSTKLYLILELGDGGDMYDYIMRHDQGLDEELAKEYFAQILCAISYCHKMHVVHRDLKPENIVFFESQGLVKLTDFGFSNLYDPGKKLSTSCGSLAYSAPEILLGDEYDAQAVDVWSLGVILYMLVCGEAPFNEANDSETLTNIMDCKYTVLDHVNKDCRDLINSMIIREPNERLKLEDIWNHPWLQDCATLRDDVSNCTPALTRDLISEELHSDIIERMVRGNLAEHHEIEKAIDDNKYNHITSTYFLLAQRSLGAQELMDVKQPETDTTTEAKTASVKVPSGSNHVFLRQITEKLPTKASVSYASSPPYQASVIHVIQTGLHQSTLPTHIEADTCEDSSPASSNSSLYLPCHSHYKEDRRMSPPFPREHLTITPRHGFSVAKGGIDTLIEEEERSRSQTTTDDEDDNMLANQDDENITCASIINPVHLASQVASLQMKRLKKRKSAPVLNEICEENESEAADLANSPEYAFYRWRDAKNPHRRRHTASLIATGRPLLRHNMETIDSEVFVPEEPTCSEDTVPELHKDVMPTFSSRKGRGRRRGGHKSSGSETSDDDSESRRASRSSLHATVLKSLNRPRRDSSGDRDGGSGCGGRRNSGPAGFSSSRHSDSEMANAENASNQNSSNRETKGDVNESEADNNNFNNSTQAELPQERLFFRCATPNISMPPSSSDGTSSGKVLNNFRERDASDQHPLPLTHICNIPEKRSRSAESNRSLKSNNNNSQTSSARSSSSSIGYRRGRILNGHRVRKSSRSTMSDTGLVLRWNNLRSIAIPNSSSSSSVASLLITIPIGASLRFLCNSPKPLHRPHSEGNVMDDHVRVGSFRSKARKRESRSTSLPRPCCYVRNNLINSRAASCGPYISHGTNRKRHCPSTLNGPMVSIQPCIPESQMTPIEPDIPPRGSSSDAKESNIKRSNISLASSTCSASKYAVDPVNELILSPMEEAEESLSGSLSLHGSNMKFFKRTKRSTSSTSADSSQGNYSKCIEENDLPTPTKMGRVKMTFFSHADTIFRRRGGTRTSSTSSTSNKKWVDNGATGNAKQKTILRSPSYNMIHSEGFGQDNALLVQKTKPDCCVIM